MTNTHETLEGEPRAEVITDVDQAAKALEDFIGHSADWSDGGYKVNAVLNGSVVRDADGSRYLSLTFRDVTLTAQGETTRQEATRLELEQEYIRLGLPTDQEKPVTLTGIPYGFSTVRFER